MQAVGKPLGVAHEPGGARVLAHADEEPLACGPRPWNGARLHLGEKLLVDALGGAAQRQLAQRRQIGRREEMLERALRLLGDIDLALLQALDQIVRRYVDKLDGIGTIEDRVRNGLAHADARDLRHDVVEALDVLDVERGVNVDAVAEKLFDIEVALRVPAAGNVGMRKLVDERQLRPARKQRVEIHLWQRTAFILEPLARNDLEAFEQRLGLFAAMRLDHADDNVLAVLQAGARLLQHLVSLADAGSGAEEDLQLAGAALFPFGLFQQGLGRGPLVQIAPLFCHEASRPFRVHRALGTRLRALPNLLAHCASSSSSARLSSSTFTSRSGVRKPPGAKTCRRIIVSTSGCGSPRAAATRFA